MQHVGACAWSAWIKEEKLKLNTLLHTQETHKTEKGQKERDLKSDFRVCVRFSSVMKYSVLCLLLEYLKYSWERFEGCCRQPRSCGSVSPACGEVRGPASQCDAHVQKIFKSFLLWFSDEVHLCVVFFFFFLSVLILLTTSLLSLLCRLLFMNVVQLFLITLPSRLSMCRFESDGDTHQKVRMVLNHYIFTFDVWKYHFIPACVFIKSFSDNFLKQLLKTPTVTCRRSSPAAIFSKDSLLCVSWTVLSLFTKALMSCFQPMAHW